MPPLIDGKDKHGPVDNMQVEWTINESNNGGCSILPTPVYSNPKGKIKAL
jgi:hypothetical protein